jgi:hypothetical protein
MMTMIATGCQKELEFVGSPLLNVVSNDVLGVRFTTHYEALTGKTLASKHEQVCNVWFG